MQKTVVIDIVGLSNSVIGAHTPFIDAFRKRGGSTVIEPMLPAVTTSVQSTYLTGKLPAETGIVGNGWYDKTDSEVKFWKQSNKLVSGEKIWEIAKREDPSFTVSKMFWWYNMYSTADYSVTPRPNYLADGRKLPDCYAHPAALRDDLQEKFGQFPLFQFWGPGASIKSSEWIAKASMYTDEKYNPTLTLIYLPHLDYCLQKFGPDFAHVAKDLQDIDNVVKELVEFYQSRKARVILLSEYGIAPVNNPVHLNRMLRKKGWLAIREERGLELLDAGASKVFAVADHQVAHVYVNDHMLVEEVRSALTDLKGVELVLDKEQQKTYGLAHERSGDLVVIADSQSWFTYYYWLDDARAPDFARTVEIFKKPGYDPVEMFMTSKGRAAYKLLRKKTGLRYVMDVIPLDATLIKGSHGRSQVADEYKPVLITERPLAAGLVRATDISGIILETLRS
jgi:predicted AlkP superfamily pyrophosphatase or phosphodiesterase